MSSSQCGTSSSQCGVGSQCGSAAQYTLIANVPYDTVRQDLVNEFRRFGRVELAMVVCDKASRHPHKEWTSTAGYAFVRFNKRAEAAAAIQAAAMGVVVIRGVRVRADWARKDSYAKRGRVHPQQGAPLLGPLGLPDGIQALLNLQAAQDENSSSPGAANFLRELALQAHIYQNGSNNAGPVPETATNSPVPTRQRIITHVCAPSPGVLASPGAAAPSPWNTGAAKTSSFEDSPRSVATPLSFTDQRLDQRLDHRLDHRLASHPPTQPVNAGGYPPGGSAYSSAGGAEGGGLYRQSTNTDEGEDDDEEEEDENDDDDRRRESSDDGLHYERGGPAGSYEEPPDQDAPDQDDPRRVDIYQSIDGPIAVPGDQLAGAYTRQSHSPQRHPNEHTPHTANSSTSLLLLASEDRQFSADLTTEARSQGAAEEKNSSDNTLPIRSDSTQTDLAGGVASGDPSSGGTTEEFATSTTLRADRNKSGVSPLSLPGFFNAQHDDQLNCVDPITPPMWLGKQTWTPPTAASREPSAFGNHFLNVDEDEENLYTHLSSLMKKAPSCAVRNGLTSKADANPCLTASIPGYADILSPCSRGLLAKALSDVVTQRVEGIHSSNQPPEALLREAVKCCDFNDNDWSSDDTGTGTNTCNENPINLQRN